MVIFSDRLVFISPSIKIRTIPPLALLRPNGSLSPVGFLPSVKIPTVVSVSLRKLRKVLRVTGAGDHRETRDDKM